MRLFIACELPLPLRLALSETSAQLRSRVRGRYVPTDSFHVTLAFLGEVPGSQAAALTAALDRACRGFAPIQARLGNLGHFGRRQTAVLWQGFEESPFDELAACVRRELDEAGFAYDQENSFLAHVTLMRGADLTVKTLLTPVCEAGIVTRVAVYASELGEEHARYTALHTCVLANGKEAGGRE